MIDFENEYQWAFVRSGELGFNISRRYDGDDPKQSLGDEYWSIILECFDNFPHVRDSVWVRDMFISGIISTISHEFEQPVNHTRTWIRGGAGWVFLDK
ncbi:MAG: hypothetical protein EOP06_18710 [Proteobacteria bacterium]|nr:MAG: hypothetical protein EOP06_18710 [Pseudomonadota bacterium]